jgi:hypothetical protein
MPTTRQSPNERVADEETEEAGVLRLFQSIAGLHDVRQVRSFTALRTRADQHQQRIRVHLADAGTALVNRYHVTAGADNGGRAHGDQAPTIGEALRSVRWSDLDG